MNKILLSLLVSGVFFGGIQSASAGKPKNLEEKKHLPVQAKVQKPCSEKKRSKTPRKAIEEMRVDPNPEGKIQIKISKYANTSLQMKVGGELTKPSNVRKPFQLRSLMTFPRVDTQLPVLEQQVITGINNLSLLPR